MTSVKYKLRITTVEVDSEHGGYCSDPGNETFTTVIRKTYIDYPNDVNDDDFDVVGVLLSRTKIYKRFAKEYNISPHLPTFCNYSCSCWQDNVTLKSVKRVRVRW